MGGGGGKINKPRAAKVSVRKRTREKKKVKKKLAHLCSKETLSDTTLRQCRTNPRAKVRLSGKKKRRLAREAKRLLADKPEMEVVELVKCCDTPQSITDIPNMDTT